MEEITNYPKPKKKLRISNIEYPKIMDLSMNDEVIITCRGKVCELYKDTYVKKGEKPKYSAEMELSDIVVKETESKKDKAAMVASILNMQPKGEKKG